MSNSIYESDAFAAICSDTLAAPKAKKAKKETKKLKKAIKFLQKAKKKECKKLRKKVKNAKRDLRTQSFIYDEKIRRIEAESKLQALELVLKLCTKSSTYPLLEGTADEA